MSAPRKSINELLEYVSRAWFPVNVALFKAIKGKMRQGQYLNDRPKLIQDLKGDFSVFSFCLRRLGEYVPRNNQSENPMTLLRGIEHDVLKTMLDVSDELISPHSFDPEMRLQAQRIKHCLISSSTAEVLAEKADLDSDLVYTTALIRQLGLNLVAWNYPRIYQNTLSAIKSTDSAGAAREIEAGLAKVLGLSPSRLGAEVAVGWNTSSEFRQALGVVEENSDPENAPIIKADVGDGREMAKFCELGETLARLNDSDNYPGSANEWSHVVGEIQSTLGPKGMGLVRDRLAAHGTGYQALSANLFKTEISQEKSLRSANSQHAQKLLAENVHIKKCPSELQHKFKMVYDNVLLGQVSPAGVNALVSMLIPAAGFNKGCIYLVEPNKMLLIPTLRIGQTSLARFRSLNCSDTGNGHPAVEALNCSTPIIQENVVVNGELVSHISGTFGNAERTGVLFLEMSKALVESDRMLSLLHFRAIRQCLNDCLNLR